MKMNQAFMAQLIQTLSSQYGGNVVLRTRNGKTEIMQSPTFKKRKLSEKQIEMNDTMRYASEYAKNVIADKKFKDSAQVRLNVATNKLYHALVKEYFQIDRGEIENPNEISADK
jgi:hypothetical protein